MRYSTPTAWLVLAIASAVLLLSSAFLLWSGKGGGGTAQELWLSIDAPSKPLVDARVGKKCLTLFHLVNNSQNRVQLLGADEACNKLGCLVVDGDLPLTLQPGESIELPIGCTPTTPGPYRGDIAIYTSSPGQQAIVLMVEGEVRE